jgi:tRNA-dihydrouridine synthase B
MSVTLSLAPFMGITTQHYRNAFARHFPGYDRVYAPFISGVHPERANKSKFSDVLPKSAQQLHTVPQFVSISAEEILAIAAVLQSQGYDHINWNMGCPFSRLADKKRGCGILPFPDDIRRILDRVMPSLGIRLSVKTRLGYYSTKELPAVINIFNQYPLHELIIHPRIGTQLYTGNTWLDDFAACLELSRIPVIFNGDVYHYTRFRQLQQMFPQVSHWMLGRGALINPFLASHIKGILWVQENKYQAIRNFHDDLLLALKGSAANERRMLGQMKAVWYYMAGAFVDGKDYLKSMRRCQDTQSYLNFADQLLHQPFADDDQVEYYWKNELKHVGRLD